MGHVSIEDSRHTLRTAGAEASSRHRLLVLRRGGSAGSPRDSAVLQALHLLGHTVFDLDLAVHPECLVPGSQQDAAPGDGPAPDRFSHEPVSAVFRRFAPEAVLMTGPGWPPVAATAEYLAGEGIPAVSMARGTGPALTGLLRVPLAPAFSRADLLRDPLPSPDAVLEVLRGGTPEAGDAGPCDHDALVAEITALAPGEAWPDATAARVVGHLASHHLDEHSLEAVLETLRTDRLLRTGTAPRPRTVMFSGYYGAGNRGDELLLDTLLGHLEDTLPGFHPVVAGSKPAIVEREHGVQSMARPDLDAGEAYAARTSSLVLGPGGHWHDYSIHQAGGAAGTFRGARVSPAHMAQLPLLVGAYGGAVHVRGMGVGPLADPAARAAVHLTGRLARTVTVRDQESARLLEPLSNTWSAEVEVSPDVVYGLPLPAPAVEARATDRRPRYLAVNLRPWTDGPEQRRLLQQGIIDVAADHGLALVGVPMQASDEPELRDLAEAARASGADVAVEVLPADLPLGDFLDILREAEGLVSMRLHANLLMHRLRRPALGLVYDPKVGSHFAELGREGFALDLDAPAPLLRDTLEALVREPELAPAACAAVELLEERARRELDRLSDALAADPLRSPDPGWIQYLPPSPQKAKATPKATPAAPATRATTDRPAPAAPDSAVSPPAPAQTITAQTVTAGPATPRPTLRRAAGRVYRGLRRRLG